MYLIPMYNETSKGQEQKSMKVAHDEELDKALYVWFIQQQTSGTPVSGPPIFVKTFGGISRIFFFFQRKWKLEIFK